MHAVLPTVAPKPAFLEMTKCTFVRCAASTAWNEVVSEDNAHYSRKKNLYSLHSTPTSRAIPDSRFRTRDYYVHATGGCLERTNLTVHTNDFECELEPRLLILVRAKAQRYGGFLNVERS